MARAGLRRERTQAEELERNTSIHVLRHGTKKPGTHPSIMQYFLDHADSSGVTHPSQVAIVGDRLFTDIMMANMMGSWGIWVRDGVVREAGMVGSPCLLFSILSFFRQSIDWLLVCSRREKTGGSLDEEGLCPSCTQKSFRGVTEPRSSRPCRCLAYSKRLSAGGVKKVSPTPR